MMFPEEIRSRLVALERAYGLRKTALIAQARFNLEQQWLALGDYSDPERMDAFARAAGGYVDRINAQIGEATVQHHVLIATLLGIGVAREVSVDPRKLTVASLRGVEHSGIPFRAAVNEMYWRLGKGDSFTDSLRKAGNRITNIGATSAQAASLRATQEAGRSLRAVGSIRVLSASGNSCEHCVADAMRIHPINEVLPLHNNCRCGSRLVYATVDSNGLDLQYALSDEQRRALLSGELDGRVKDGVYGAMFDYSDDSK